MAPNTKPSAMIFPFIAVGVIALVFIKVFSKPHGQTFNEFQHNRMKNRFYDIKHMIRFCPTTTALEDVEDNIIEYFEMYKFLAGVKGYTAELWSDLNNKRMELRNERRIRA